MNEKDTKSRESAPVLPSISVRVFPTPTEDKQLAKASITLGGCFTINQVRLYNSKNGLFIAMPSTRGTDGNFHDICRPATKEMREALTSAVIDEYHHTVELIAARGQDAVKKSSVIDKLQQTTRTSPERPAPAPAPDREAR